MYPLVLISPAAHSIFATTTSGMYDYLPMSQNHSIHVPMVGATVFFLSSTPSLIGDVIKWWVLCALEKDCMAPPGHSLYCNFRDNGGDRFAKYAHCHRYDQSALNILVAIANNYEMRQYESVDHSALMIDKLQ
jgi:hypothetical protein